MRADHQHATGVGLGVRDDVLRGRAMYGASRAPARRSSSKRPQARARQRRRSPATGIGDACGFAEGAVEQSGLRVEDEQGDRAGVVCVPRLDGEEAGSPACERDEAPHLVEVARLAPVVGCDHPSAEAAFRGRRGVVERLDAKLSPGRSDLGSLLEALPVQDEGKADGARLVSRPAELGPNVSHRRAVARGARGSISAGADGDSLESEQVCTHSGARQLAWELVRRSQLVSHVFLIGCRVARHPSGRDRCERERARSRARHPEPYGCHDASASPPPQGTLAP